MRIVRPNDGSEVQVVPAAEGADCRDRLAEIVDWGASTEGWSHIEERLDEMKAALLRARSPQENSNLGNRARSLAVLQSML